MAVLLLAALTPIMGRAAPFAAMVMDARTGEVYHSDNATTRLHPASLTKMMTLWIAFEAVERGELTLDTVVTISQNAASTPYALGFRAGSQVRVRHLMRAAAVRSSNDAATALAEAISGSVPAFADRMNRTARAMGMTDTTFRNPHGLTENGHLSTARDMTILGRHMVYDWPEYYNLFSRRSTDVGITTVQNTNRRWLDSYVGADGIKTGYTDAAGSNLVASAERSGVRIIVTVFGGRGRADRDARVTQLMDLGFSRAPAQVAMRRPERPDYAGNAGAVVRISGAVTVSPRPQARPEIAFAAAGGDDRVDRTLIDAAIAEALGGSAGADELLVEVAMEVPEQEIIERLSTNSGRHWGINVGRYGTRHQAERVLLRVALNEMSTLDGSLRRVVQGSGGFEANFVGLTQETADLACRRLQARSTPCAMIQPPG